MKNKEDLIYDLIFSEKSEFDINISEYIGNIYKYESFIKEIKEVLESKFVKFKLNPKDTTPAPNGLIYLDTSLILKYVKTKAENTSALTYLDISLKLDGIAGISCGEFFHIDGVPEIYNKNGYFQVTNVKHSIDDKGWETTIEAGYRINSENTI